MDTLEILKREIFQNPDIVSKISENFDYLSQQDRINYVEMLNNIPELSELLSSDFGTELLETIFQSRAQYNQSRYNSIIKQNKDLVTPRFRIPWSYEFAIVYPKGDPEPIVDEVCLAGLIDNEIAYERNDTPLRNYQECIKGGLVWTLNGPAGKIKKRNDIIYQIYCNDRELFTIYKFTHSDSMEEIWYKNKKIHRDGDEPAFIQYHWGIKDSEKWYVNDEIHREGDKPAWIEYRDNMIRSEFWYKHNKRYRGSGKPSGIYYFIDARYKTQSPIREEIYTEGFGDKKCTIRYNRKGEEIVRFIYR